MGSFNISVKPEIINSRVQAAETKAIDGLVAKHQLDKAEILGDGLDMSEAGHLSLDMFSKLSQNDTKITKDDLLKFADAPTADTVIREYAQNIADSIPSKVLDSASSQSGEAVSELLFQVEKKGSEIILSATRSSAGGSVKAATDATAAGVFSIINGHDTNGDNQISLGGELKGSIFASTTGDAIKLAQGDMVVTPIEALEAVLSKKGLISTADLDIKYNN